MAQRVGRDQRLSGGGARPGAALGVLPIGADLAIGGHRLTRWVGLDHCRPLMLPPDRARLLAPGLAPILWQRMPTRRGPRRAAIFKGSMIPCLAHHARSSPERCS